MTSLETEILNVLDKLDASARAVKSGAPRQSGTLLPLLTKLDEMTTRLPHDADPQLLHFLRKKSYQKAREHLQGRPRSAIQTAMASSPCGRLRRI